MTEKFEGEKGPAPENLEDQEYRKLQEAMAEEDRILEEINNIFTSTSNRAAAESVILAKHAPLMDEAMKKAGVALRAWIDAMEKSEERFIKEEERRKERTDPSPSLQDKTGYIPEDEFSFKSPEEMKKKDS